MNDEEKALWLGSYLAALAGLSGVPETTSPLEIVSAAEDIADASIDVLKRRDIPKK